MFKARVILDSIGSTRLTTVEATYPRCIHSEILTHRDRARNSASSRAIPWKKNRPRRANESEGEYVETVGMPKPGFDHLHPKCMMHMILNDPFVPIEFGKEQKGMQSGDLLVGSELGQAQEVWLNAMNSAVHSANKLADLGVHKSIVNRLTEPFMWITVIMTATEWKNFFRLRCHPDAEIHFQKIAGMIRTEMEKSRPKLREHGEWHCPYLDSAEQNALDQAFADSDMLEVDRLKRISAGRCARVSYLTHDGTRNPDLDVELCNRLIMRDDNVIHASPLEHVAQSRWEDMHSGPFRGWYQFRKEFMQENVSG